MKSIRSKIMWLLFGGVLIASLIISSVCVLVTSSIIEKNANENMTLLCKTKADSIDILFAKAEDSMDTLAHSASENVSEPKMLKNKQQRAQFIADIEKSALHHVESVQGAKSIYLYIDPYYIGDSDGFYYVKNDHTGHFEKKNLPNVPSYRSDELNYVGWWHIPVEQGRPTWIASYYNANIDHYTSSYVVPIYKDDQLIGVVGADLSIEYIVELIKEISVFDSGKAAVLKSDGTVVYHPNFDRDTLIGEGDPGFEGVVKQLSAKDRTDAPIGYKLDGVEKRIASCKLRNSMLMVCFAPVSEIYQTRTVLIILSIIFTALILGCALAVAALVSNKVAQPIKDLNEAAKHLTDGNYDFNITAVSKDEVGQLTATFLETRKILSHQFHLLDTEAHKDGLTGVNNKSAFIDKELQINQQIRTGEANFAIAVFDVNRLKITNDVFGHLAGDKLLATTAAHLSTIFDPADIYRVGGDEFAVILTGKKSARCDSLAAECVQKMQALTVEGYPDCPVSCAYGTSHFDILNDRQLADVLHRADKQMYKNKALSKKQPLPWQGSAKGIKQLQVEKYCNLLQTLRSSTDDYLFLLNTETGTIHVFGEDLGIFNIADGQALTNGIGDMLAFVHTNDQPFVRDAVLTIINQESESLDINFRMHNNNNNMRWVNCRGSVIHDDEDNHFVMIGRLSQNAVKHLYNPITTLFNKTKMKQDFQKDPLPAFRYMMLMDIDNLSDINLKHGSIYGDKLLQQLAESLERHFAMWQIYHAEKDRFVILLDTIERQEITQTFEQLRADMAGKCSISASAVPNDSNLYISIENMYDYAVQGLINAKRGNLGQVAFFSKESILEKISSVELLEDLKACVNNKCEGFYLEYQPQIRADDCTMVAAEALLRFESKTKGRIYPDRFIPILEQSGLIHEVGIWVINQALLQCKHWRSFMPDFKISVNLSPKQLEKKRIAAQVKQLLEKHNLPGEALILEITESSQLEENEELYATLEKFTIMGIQIAIDDFGTGYSNLGNLKHIHASILKIDRIFIRDIRENGYNYNLVHNVIEFAKTNNLKVCLEGVETINELIVLSAMTPDTYQGYLFDRPKPAQEIEARYFLKDTAAYSKREQQVAQLLKERQHAPIVNIETKTILRGINTGLWIIRINADNGICELYTDETMKELLGVDEKISPKDCYRHWWDNIPEQHRPAVTAMVEEMLNTDKVVQVEYPWHHPKLGAVAVRCSGRCDEKHNDFAVFEGFHRILYNISEVSQ